jgi:hypothetical protein
MPVIFHARIEIVTQKTDSVTVGIRLIYQVGTRETPNVTASIRM